MGRRDDDGRGRRAGRRRKGESRTSRWLTERLGLSEARPFFHAARGLADGAEVAFPRELLPLLATQLGRGLLSALTIPGQPERVWPYWALRQLDPEDPAYLPRGLSPLWLNLTHRTWTAVGTLDGRREAVVDPRGLVTPWHAGWSVECGVQTGGALHVPARLKDGYEQRLDDALPRVTGRWQAHGLHVAAEVWVERAAGTDFVLGQVTVTAGPAPASGELVLSLRPYDAEGVAVVEELEVRGDWWFVDGRPALRLAESPGRVVLARFREGDAMVADPAGAGAGAAAGSKDAAGAGAARDRIRCEAGLATAAAFFPFDLGPNATQTVGFSAMVDRDEATAARAEHVGADLDGLRGPTDAARRVWRRRFDDATRLRLPDPALQAAFDRAHLTLLTLDGTDGVRPGPATYDAPRIRDAAFMVTALARLGHRERARHHLARQAAFQERGGAFRTQSGEWDATGQAIWSLLEHHRLFGDDGVLAENLEPIARAARWISDARRGPRPPGCEGLLPAGLSAEHLGLHDFYLWDDLWGLAGLRGAAAAERRVGRGEAAEQLDREADAFMADLAAALRHAEARLGRPAMPAAPNRGYDPGMIGGLAAVWPLGLFAADDPRITDTLEVLESRFFLDGAFFQPWVQSGLVPHLTLRCAHVHLRAGRTAAAWRLTRRVLGLSRPAGVWPEAVHPRTGGGCMGDGCHGWTAAEWLLLLRDAVLGEEGDALVVTPGWGEGAPPLPGLELERAPTGFGEVSLAVEGSAQRPILELRPRLRTTPRRVEWRLPGPVVRAEVDGRPVETHGNRVRLPAAACRVTAQLAE